MFFSLFFKNVAQIELSNRNNCGYCFKMFQKIPRGTSAVKSSVKLFPANMGFANFQDFNSPQIFRTQNQLSRGVLQKQLFSIS